MTVLVCVLAGAFYGWRRHRRGVPDANAVPLAATPPGPRPVAPTAGKAASSAHAISEEGTAGSPQPPDAIAEIERHKEIDRDHLRKLHAGIFAFKAKHGHFPEYLSQLVPEFVTAEALVSPHKKEGARDLADIDHPDPAVAQPSYGFEFSNLEFRDGRTFFEIKEIQRAEWGDAIPLLRCFAYGDTVINMAYGGELYETALNWEWDAGTMDMVAKFGWGPGLDSGEKVAVRVTTADGTPVAGANVWADGRNYSFDLPNRPFPTDANGYAQIPVGVDIDRTTLQLRAEAPGLASPPIRFAAGELPDSPSLVVENAQTIGGIALDANGQPMANARVYLKSTGTNDGGGFGRSNVITNVLTDQSGKWQTSIHPQDAASLNALIGVPGGIPVKFAQGQALDPAAAAAGKAVVRLAEGE